MNQSKLNFSWLKVSLIFLLTAVLPLLVFTIPIVNESNQPGYLDGILKKLEVGVLFTTSFSITATLITLYFDNTLKRNGELIKGKSLESTNILIVSCIVLIIINGVFYGQTIDGELSRLGILLQILLYILVLLIYGLSDAKIQNSPEITIEYTKDFEENQNEKIAKQTSDIESNEIKDNIDHKKIT